MRAGAFTRITLKSSLDLTCKGKAPLFDPVLLDEEVGYLSEARLFSRFEIAPPCISLLDPPQ